MPSKVEKILWEKQIRVAGESLPITYFPPGQTTMNLFQWEVMMGKLVKAQEDPPLSQGEIPASALLLTSLWLSTVSPRPCLNNDVLTAGPSSTLCSKVQAQLPAGRKGEGGFSVKKMAQHTLDDSRWQPASTQANGA